MDNIKKIVTSIERRIKKRWYVKDCDLRQDKTLVSPFYIFKTKRIDCAPQTIGSLLNEAIQKGKSDIKFYEKQKKKLKGGNK